MPATAKSCYGCRALTDDRRPQCRLGYLVQQKLSGCVVRPVPLGKCPKPRTHAKLKELLDSNATEV